MLKRTVQIILFLFIALYSTGLLAAQDTSDEPTSRVWHTVESVILESASTEDDGGGWQLRISGTYQAGCNYPVVINQDYDDGWLSVEIYRAVPPDTRCGTLLSPFEEIVVLEEEIAAEIERSWEDPDLLFVIEVNAEPGETVYILPGTPTSFPIPFIPTERQYMPVTAITVDTKTSPITFSIEGYHPTMQIGLLDITLEYCTP